MQTPHPVDAFACPRCGQNHPYGEPGFNWPDAFFALGITDEERDEIAAPGDNEDFAVVRGACFVRSVLLVPVVGWRGPIALGLWAKISAADYGDFLRRSSGSFGPYAATIANQATFLGPTFGLRARLTSRGIDTDGKVLRPLLTLEDATHPLVRAQREGVSAEIASAWIADTVHVDEPEPPRPPPPAQPDLQREGYRLVSAEEAGRPAASFDRAPRVGDNVKVVVQFIAANETGDSKPIVAGWWLDLDTIAHDHWSGTLINAPRCPAPIVLGSRFWIRPEHVIEWAPGE